MVIAQCPRKVAEPAGPKPPTSAALSDLLGGTRAETLPTDAPTMITSGRTCAYASVNPIEGKPGAGPQTAFCATSAPRVSTLHIPVPCPPTLTTDEPAQTGREGAALRWPRSMLGTESREGSKTRAITPRRRPPRIMESQARKPAGASLTPPPAMAARVAAQTLRPETTCRFLGVITKPLAPRSESMIPPRPTS